MIYEKTDYKYDLLLFNLCRDLKIDLNKIYSNEETTKLIMENVPKNYPFKLKSIKEKTGYAICDILAHIIYNIDNIIKMYNNPSCPWCDPKLRAK